MKRRSLLALLLVFSLLFSLIAGVSAATAKEIQQEIEALEEEADAIAQEKEALEAEMAAVGAEALSLAEEKMQIDYEIELLRQTEENLNKQLSSYNYLIAERQAQVDTLRAEHEELQERYSQRMRAVQERGTVSIWSVLFSADSFADMLNSRVMIEEIARSDQNMMQELRESSQKILDAKDALAAQKTQIELKRQELEDVQTQLDARREEMDALIAEINADIEKKKAYIMEIEEMEQALIEEIGKKEQEYNEKLKEQNNGFVPNPNEKGFIFPVDPSGFVYLSSPYGMRYHPVTGIYKMHNGVDFAAYRGTKTYAAKSGVVTTAGYGRGWGNYVVVNHGDGFSTLYAHFDSIAVSVGQVVSQGQVVGYVGTTGSSTGYHLHFTVYYNGATVDPMRYVSLP